MGATPCAKPTAEPRAILTHGAAPARRRGELGSHERYKCRLLAGHDADATSHKHGAKRLAGNASVSLLRGRHHHSSSQLHAWRALTDSVPGAATISDAVLDRERGDRDSRTPQLRRRRPKRQTDHPFAGRRHRFAPRRRRAKVAISDAGRGTRRTRSATVLLNKQTLTTTTARAPEPTARLQAAERCR